MSKPRRRKTPETEIAATIRRYAAGYAATGSKERAEGLLQAADLIDGFLAGGAPPPLPSLLEDVPRHPASSIEERLAVLEGLVTALVGRPLADKVDEVIERRARANGQIRIDRKSHKGQAPVAELTKFDGDTAVVFRPEVALAPGEELVLRAIAQGADSNDFIMAMVGYRETSLRTFLGELRAAGFVETSGGRHTATDNGKARVAGKAPLPIGFALFEWWRERVSPGEQRILAVLQNAADGVKVSALVGEATGLKETSVRTYVQALVQRRIVVRREGRIDLAPIVKVP